MTSLNAIATASSWARRFYLRPSTFAKLVTATSSQVLEFTRIRWRGRRREIVARTAPTDSRSRKLGDPLDPRSFDPWAEDAATLPSRTRQLVECSPCDGAKKLTCPDCRGTALVGCSTCTGRGSVYSSRSGRVVNCRSCRGQGQRRCPCRDGLVRCPACAGRGKVDRWLEVAEERFARVTHTPLDLLAASLADPADPASFDLPPTAQRLAPEEAWSGATTESPPPHFAHLVSGASPLAIRLDPLHDRLDDVAVQTFRGIASTVSYQLLGATSSIHLQHWNGRLSETPTSRQPFRRRLALLAAVVLVSLIIGLAVATSYAAQHPYLAANASSLVLFLLAPALASAALWPATLLALPRRAWRPRRLLAALLPVLAIVTAQAAAATSGYPSLERARALATSGQVDQALREAAATADLGLDPGAAAFHDELLLVSALAVTDPLAAWEASRATYYTEQARKAAETHALDLTVARASELQEKGEFVASEGVLAAIPESIADATGLRPLRLAAHLDRAGACADKRNATCVRNELRRARTGGFGDDELAPIYQRAVAAASPLLRDSWSVIRSRQALTDRLAACREIQRPFDFLAAIDAPSALHPVDRDESRDLCRQLDDQRRREEEQRLRREEQNRVARQRAWSRAPLLCNDGTLSPSCVCGQTSRRGCCSWHRGVAGCSAPYPS